MCLSPQLRGATGEQSATTRVGQVPPPDPPTGGQQVNPVPPSNILFFGVKPGGFGAAHPWLSPSLPPHPAALPQHADEEGDADGV